MSLLIKALDKAQEAKAQAAKTKQALDAPNLAGQASADMKRKPIASNQSHIALEKVAAANALEMELSPISKNPHSTSAVRASAIEGADERPSASPFNLQESANQISAENKASSKNAANVFAAKRIEPHNGNTILALTVGIGFCALLVFAAYFYLFAGDTPEFNMPQAATLPANTAPAVTPVAGMIAESPAAIVDEPTVSLPAELADAKMANAPVKTAKTSVFRDESLAENESVLTEAPADLTLKNAQKMPPANRAEVANVVEVERIASKSASIEVSKTKPQSGVNPNLMEAYNAYNAGNDAVASKLYRQVLQRDLRNVDALLGLGAIAQRQGRIADANGWYGKVLEVEPRNVLATTAILENHPQSEAASQESRIKNMLAKQPDDANLHVALGNFYADTNQWSAAQQAYFEAYRLNASADNAFNLAVGLDQMGKPKLALPYYQQALQRVQTERASFDTDALQARIRAIQ